MIAVIVIVILITITTITILMVFVSIYGTILKSIKYITVTWARSRLKKRESCHHPDIPSPPARKRIMSNSTVWSCENSSAVNFRKFTLVLGSSKRAVVFRLISPLVVFFWVLGGYTLQGGFAKAYAAPTRDGFYCDGCLRTCCVLSKKPSRNFLRALFLRLLLEPLIHFLSEADESEVDDEQIKNLRL